MTDNEKIALVEALRPITSRVRTDVCWKKTDDGPRRVDAALTDARMLKHINGGPAFGAAPIRAGESVTLLGVLDFDSHKGETPWPEMQAAAMRVADALERAGGKPVAFRSSGGQGIHLYTLWDEPQDAYSVREWLRAALAAAGLKSGAKGVSGGEVEIFPKQDSVADSRYGNMFVLPLAGASAPLDPFELDDLPRDYLVGMAWPMSAPVPRLEKPERALAVASAGDADVAMLRSALAGIPNEATAELDYDAWRNVMFAIHHAAGAEVGQEIAHEFSARSSKYDPDFLDNRVWPYIESEREGAVTVGTILTMARAAGWREPADLVAADFDAVEPAPGEPERAPLPRFERNGKGEILATIGNLVLAVRDARCCDVRIQYDNFRAEIMAAPADDPDGWRSFDDADYTRIQIFMEANGFQKIAKESLRDAVWLVARENQFDSAILWLSGLQHDGVARVDSFLSTYCGVADTPYSRAVSRYIWTALAGRVMEPGVKADMVPVLIGAQGARKSTGVAAMSPANDFFTEMDLASRDAEASRMMRGRLVIELAELKGLHTKDAESIKAFITRTHEEWRVLYKEFSTKFPRRHLFIGTSNPSEFLSDDSGERRWLPVEVLGMVDVAAIERDRLQLWAEGRDRFARGGVDWHDAETLARDVHAQHKISDAWETSIAAWVEHADFDDLGTDAAVQAPRAPRDRFSTADVLVGALRFEMKAIKRGDEMRAGSILRKFGFEKIRDRRNGTRTPVWNFQGTNAQDSANSQNIADSEG